MDGDNRTEVVLGRGEMDFLLIGGGAGQYVVSVQRPDEAYTMRRKADVHFGRVCQFFDTDERRCTIYTARPSTCRTYPGGRCGYYDFLTFERNTQDDPEHIAGTWNK